MYDTICTKSWYNAVSKVHHVLHVSKLVPSSPLVDSQREEELDKEVDNLHSTGDERLKYQCILMLIMMLSMIIMNILIMMTIMIILVIMMETPENGESSEKTHGATNQPKLGLHGHLKLLGSC